MRDRPSILVEDMEHPEVAGQARDGRPDGAMPAQSGVGAPQADPQSPTPEPRPLSWHQIPSWLWRPTLVFLVTRLGLFILAYLAVALLHGRFGGEYHTAPGNVFLDAWGGRWDSGFYLNIATEGYAFPKDHFANIAFLPVYPLLVYSAKLLVGNVVLGAVLVSNLAFWLALIMLYRLAALDFGEEVAARAIFYMAIFPTALYFSAAYTESVFLLSAVTALYAARRGAWGLAALAGLLACATRLVGIVLAPVLFVEWAHQRWWGAGARAAGALAPLFVPAGLVSYLIFLGRAFGDPTAYLQALQAWERQPQPFMLAASSVIQAIGSRSLDDILAGNLPLSAMLDLGFIVVFLVLGLAMLRNFRPAYGLFVFFGAALPATSGILLSMPRYVAVLFPAFIALAVWSRREWLDHIIVVASLLLLALFTILFVNWYWVA